MLTLTEFVLDAVPKIKKKKRKGTGKLVLGKFFVIWLV